MKASYFLRRLCCVAAVSIGSLGASEIATATISFNQLTATTFHYDLMLNDVGTTNIGTFWFGWVPGQDYMPTFPGNITGPAGWGNAITGGGAGDGYAIRWIAGAGSALTPGQSASGFGFDSTTTPQQMFGASQFFSNPPVLTSFVYSAGPFSDAGLKFVVTATPEPSSAALTILGVCLLIGLSGGAAQARTVDLVRVKHTL